MSEHRLSEIVIERPRGGMRISLKKLKGYRKELHRITEEAGEDGLLSPYRIRPRNKSKYLSDHLGPLRRFLRSHINQPWNQVHSKLCRRLDSNTMAGQHVLTHVWDYVERHVELIDGIPYAKTCRGFRRRLDQSYREQFYVHPETGLLCAAEHVPRPSWRIPPRTDVVILDDYHQYQQVDGIWYLIGFEEFPPPPQEWVRDRVQGMLHRSEARRVGDRPIYAAHKRQCNKKEIRSILNQRATD